MRIYLLYHDYHYIAFDSEEARQLFMRLKRIKPHRDILEQVPLFSENELRVGMKHFKLELPK